MAEEQIDYDKKNTELQAEIDRRLKDVIEGIERLKRINVRLRAAGRAVIDAYGGDVPDWLEEEFAELENALEEVAVAP